MVVDRNELESQLFRNITSYGITTLRVAQNKDNLEEILSTDYRGLVVSMIHKFDKRPANLNTRESVVVLIDEAHRTTGGDFGNYLMAALPNATYIGFTGTPIDRLSKGEGTFKVFGVDDEQGYLDKYAIVESIEDGTTVSLNYTLAASELWVDHETLDEECALAGRESEQLGMDENTFAVYTVLRNVIEDINPEQARAVDQVFTQFSDYQWNVQQEKDLRTILYKTLRPTVGAKELIEITNKLLRLERV